MTSDTATVIGSNIQRRITAIVVATLCAGLLLWAMGFRLVPEGVTFILVSHPSRERAIIGLAELATVGGTIAGDDRRAACQDRS